MRIVVDAIPYQVNKSMLLERIAELVRDGRIEGITDLRDESNREGMRVVIELRRDAPEEIILNQLYKMTPLQSTFGVNLLALVNGRPQTLGMKEAISHFIEFRKEVVIRRAIYDLAQAEARAHILEGFVIALDNLDEVIRLIRASDTTAEARTALMERFALSERQAQAILDMRLRALTAMERQRVIDELEELRAKIADLRDLLASDSRILDVVVEEVEDVAARFGDERRTELTDAVEGISTEDLIAEEDMVVTLSHLGYIKRNPITLYRQQRRGGKGARGMETREEDFVEHLGVASTHAYLLFFTNRGRVYWLKVHELPQLGRAARGKAIVNVLSLQEGERVQTMLPVRSFEGIEDESILLATRKGVVKKTPLSAYSNPRRSGIIAINLGEGDELIGAGRCTTNNQVILASKRGKSIRFDEGQVRAMGRTATGVRGIAVAGDDEVVGMEILTPGAAILTVTERGYGKRTPLDEYRLQNRGGSGHHHHQDHRAERAGGGRRPGGGRGPAHAHHQRGQGAALRGQRHLGDGTEHPGRSHHGPGRGRDHRVHRASRRGRRGAARGGGCVARARRSDRVGRGRRRAGRRAGRDGRVRGARRGRRVGAWDSRSRDGCFGPPASAFRAGSTAPYGPTGRWTACRRSSTTRRAPASGTSTATSTSTTWAPGDR